MTDDSQTKGYDWEAVWNARVAALAEVFGKPSDNVLHAAVPLQLGGSADVLAFPNYVAGITYVTSEMTGEDASQRPSSLGYYELVICVRQELQRAGDLVSMLARYTCDTVLEPGHTMDLGEFFRDSTIRALLFALPSEEPVRLEFLGKCYGLLLCIGITAEELAFKQANDSKCLLALLKQYGVFPYTTPDRPSVPLPPDGHS
jgi:Suppressor of fused protein (SUFU)